jgi:hypothetical protein
LSSLLERTFDEIWKYLDRLVADTGSKSYEDVIRTIRTIRRYLMPSAVLLTLAGPMLPDANQPEKFDEYVNRIDTEVKLRALLLDLDEPDRNQRRLILALLKHGVPMLRRFMLGAGERLRPSRGGVKQEFTDSEKDEIGAEIRRRHDGKNLKALCEQIGARKRVSSKTIQRIWYEGKYADDPASPDSTS